MELNKINSTGNWGSVAEDINQNFSKVNNAVEQVKNATTRNKGYYSTEADLKSAFTTANVGDIAYVGSAYPYQTWTWDGTGWVKKNNSGGDEQVNLGNYYTKEETDGKFDEADAKLSELGSEVDKKANNSLIFTYEELSKSSINRYTITDGGVLEYASGASYKTYYTNKFEEDTTVRVVINKPSTNTKKCGLIAYCEDISSTSDRNSIPVMIVGGVNDATTNVDETVIVPSGNHLIVSYYDNGEDVVSVTTEIGNSRIVSNENEIKKLKEQLNGIALDKKLREVGYSWTDFDCFWDLDGTKVYSMIVGGGAPNFACVNEISVKKGDSFILTTRGSGTARAYAFADLDKVIVEVAESGELLTDRKIVAPTDGYLYVNYTKSKGEPYYLLPCTDNIISKIATLDSNLEKQREVDNAIYKELKKKADADYIFEEIATTLFKSSATRYTITDDGFYQYATGTSYKTYYTEKFTEDTFVRVVITKPSENTRKCGLIACCESITNASSSNSVPVTILGGVNDATTNVDETVVVPSGNLLLVSYCANEEIVVAVTTEKVEYVNKVERNADEISKVNKKIESLDGQGVACMYNPPINLLKENLKILDIGNSYTVDSQAYLSQIIDAFGLDTNGVSLYTAVRGGASFKSWYDCYNDNDSYDSYSIYKKLGDGLEGVSGSGVAYDGTAFRNALSAVKWDVILIHQSSVYANDFESWNGNGNGGYLKEFIQVLRKTNPQASIGFLLVHSYRGTYHGNKEGSSLQRWENIAKSAKSFKSNYGVDFIIPYGTAVQNLRASSINDDYEFSTDGTHMAAGLGDYVASCCYYQSLLAPRYGISIIGNTFRDVSIDDTVEGVKKINDDNALLAQKAAMLATYNMWNVMNPEDFGYPLK